MLHTETQVRAQFETRRPVIIQNFTKFITETFEKTLEYVGPTHGDWDAVRRDWGTGKWEAVRNMSRYYIREERILWAADGVTVEYSRTREDMAALPVRLDTDMVAKDAVKEADHIIDCLTAKVMKKIGDLQDADLYWAVGVNFTLTGTRSGRKIRIEQQQIYNFSVKGKMFNQYPARIYVDGKFTSAKKYDEMDWPADEPAAPEAAPAARGGWDAKIATALENIECIADGCWVITGHDMKEMGWPASASKHGAYWSNSNPAGKAARRAGFNVRFLKGALHLEAA